MHPFEFFTRPKLIVGAGTLSKLGELAIELGGSRALVVSDPGIVSTGHTSAGVSTLKKAGVDCILFDQFAENPTTDHIASGASFARETQPDIIIAIGGGSSLDCAKGINFLHSFGGEMQDYWGRNKAPASKGPMIPSIAVPTTAGTGSETQSFALITDSSTHVKMACGDSRASFRAAILDVNLTLTQPHRVTSLTAIDAVSHAVESHVCRTATPASRLFSKESWALLANNVPKIFDDPTNKKARASVQLGAAWAGIAIEHSMLGATHSCANPLTSQFNIAHGQAVGVMLPHVVRFNTPSSLPEYSELAQIIAPSVQTSSAGEWLAEWLFALLDSSQLATHLSSLNITATDINSLASAATREWTASFNPRTVSSDDFFNLYEAAL